MQIAHNLRNLRQNSARDVMYDVHYIINLFATKIIQREIELCAYTYLFVNHSLHAERELFRIISPWQIVYNDCRLSALSSIIGSRPLR